MPVTAHPYELVNLATAKEHLNINPTNLNFDDIVQRFINMATVNIEHYIDRQVLQRSYTEYQDGRGNNRTLVKQWPAQKPSEVWLDSTGLFTNAENQLDASTYELEMDARGNGIGIVLLSGRRFVRGTRNVKIVYQGGYITTPDDLIGAALFTVEYYYDMRNDRRVGLDSKGKNQENTRYLSDLPNSILGILEKYKRCEWPLGTVAVENT